MAHPNPNHKHGSQCDECASNHPNDMFYYSSEPPAELPANDPPTLDDMAFVCRWANNPEFWMRSDVRAWIVKWYPLMLNNAKELERLLGIRP